MESPYVSRGYRAFILSAGAYDMIVGLSLFFLYPVMYVVLSFLDPGLDMCGPTSYEMAHMKLNGIFMFFVGMGYLFPYANYEKFKFYIPIFGIGLRGWGGGFLIYTHLAWNLSFIYTIFGAIDLLFAVGFVFFLSSYRSKKVHIRNY
jgi:hypothetical protein